MGKNVWLCLSALLLTGCASGGKGGETVLSNTFTVRVINKSYFTVELIDDSRLVAGNSEGSITLPRYTGEVDDGYSLTYRVRLLDDVYIKIRRGENVIVKPEQESLLIEAAVFSLDESFIVLKNESAHTVRIRNSEGYLANLENAELERRYGSSNIAVGASALFDAVPRNTVLSVESDNYRTSPFPLDTFKRGFRYLFAFDGAKVALVDARPLSAIGAPSTVKTLPRLPEAVDPAVEAKLPGAKAYAYRKIHALAPRDGGVFLAVGEADELGGFGREPGAYLCESAETGSGGYAVRWEFGPNDLEPALGPARSAYYDAGRKVYRVLGELLEYDDRRNLIPASYLIELDETGKRTRPALVLRGCGLSKVIADAAGSFYLSGEAAEAERNVALLVKYSGEGVQLWRKAAALPLNSYYQDALFDEDENQIVAAGVQNGKTGAGDGGSPFIRGVNAETGETLWHSELTAATLRDTALAYRIEKSADYGYRVALCGVSENRPAPPYLEAGVNTRGRFIEAEGR